MTLTAFIFIFSSIILHSLWHFLCKSSGKASMSFYALFSTSLFLTMLPGALLSGIFFNLPAEVIRYAFWGAFCGAVCNAGMMLGYKYSDISLAYPAARALPVFFTMAATGIFGLGKSLSATAVIGMLIIFSGCIAMAFSNGDKNKSPLQKILSIKKGLIGILIASLATTGYTIVDSYGIKAILSAFPENNRFFVTCSYSCIRELLAMTLMWTGVFLRRLAGTEKGLVKDLAATYHPYLAGVFAALAYALILLAMNNVTNVSFVQAFRQLSLPVSALLGLWILKEKITLFRWCALGTIMFGLMLSLL
jgi:drug/metabolite transporter (DMT)-like permease